MRCPFPGMDPFLEDPAFWQDFHRSFMDDIRDAVLQRLPEAYDARMDESLRLIDAGSSLATSRYPDVGITRGPEAPSATYSERHAMGSVATLEPLANAMREVEEVRDVWIEVRHRDERELVTVIEVLSPANKAGKGWYDYDNKRRQLVEQHVNLVEIDLLLAGRRLDLRDPLPEADYFAFVTRDDPRRLVDVYRWRLEDQLPPLPIPLRPPDADIGLDLAPIFERTWTRGRYARVLRYDRPLPALDAGRQEWTRERIDQARKS